MNYDSYGDAAAQALDVLKHISKNDAQRIPKSIIEYLESIKSKDYEVSIDYSKNIEDIKLMPKTEAILGWIYMKYCADEEGLKKFRKKIKENEIKHNEELKKRFDTDNLFKKENRLKIKNQDEKNTQIGLKKESIFRKLINFLKKFK